jgi:hypothetical protein
VIRKIGFVHAFSRAELNHEDHQGHQERAIQCKQSCQFPALLIGVFVVLTMVQALASSPCTQPQFQPPNCQAPTGANFAPYLYYVIANPVPNAEPEIQGKFVTIVSFYCLFL